MMNYSGNEWNCEIDPSSKTEELVMNSPAKLPIVIYHNNCADGFSAAWVFHHISKTIPVCGGFEFFGGTYNEPPPDCAGRDVYLVDFSYKNDVLKEILAVAKKVWLIDHHKTALEAVFEDMGIFKHPKFHMYCDMERSGAMLAWDFWHNAILNEVNELASDSRKGDPSYIAPPRLLEHVQDRDLWRFKLPLTREIQANVFSYEYTFENWDKLMLETSLAVLGQGGMAIERKHHKDIAELVAVCARLMHIGGIEVPVASLPYVYSSDAGHLMAKEFQEGTKFAACYWDTKDHRIFSLRSTENGMDVSEIAKSYGGGGHKHAAGFRVNRADALAML